MICIINEFESIKKSIEDMDSKSFVIGAAIGGLSARTALAIKEHLKEMKKEDMKRRYKK
jgi:hypothetical protein